MNPGPLSHDAAGLASVPPPMPLLGMILQSQDHFLRSPAVGDNGAKLHRLGVFAKTSE